MRREVLGVLVLSAIVGLAACGDYVAPVSSPDEAFQVGEPLQFEDYSITIDSVEERTAVGGDVWGVETPVEGGTLIVVRYTVVNTGNRPISIWQMPVVQLEDPNGAILSANIGKSAAFASTAQLTANGLSDLNPGLTATDAEVFEVSKSQYDPTNWFVRVNAERIAILSPPAEPETVDRPGGSYQAVRLELLQAGFEPYPLRKLATDQTPYPELGLCTSYPNEGLRCFGIFDSDEVSETVCTTGPAFDVIECDPMTVRFLNVWPVLEAGLPAELLDTANYLVARSRMLSMGYSPIDVGDLRREDCSGSSADEPFVCAYRQACEEDYGSEPRPYDAACPTPLFLPEVSDCSGTGMAFCEIFWRSPEGRIMRVIASGEPQPGGITHLEWASLEDIAR